jgi:hypothetical protein
MFAVIARLDRAIQYSRAVAVDIRPKKGGSAGRAGYQIGQ